MNKTVKQALIEAREILTSEGSWTKLYPALDRNNNSCWGDDPHAVRWCSFGAVVKATGRLHRVRKEAMDALLFDVVSNVDPELGVISYNDLDSTTHADVLALFDRAIAAQP